MLPQRDKLGGLRERARAPAGRDRCRGSSPDIRQLESMLGRVRGNAAARISLPAEGEFLSGEVAPKAAEEGGAETHRGVPWRRTCRAGFLTRRATRVTKLRE